MLAILGFYCRISHCILFSGEAIGLRVFIQMKTIIFCIDTLAVLAELYGCKSSRIVLDDKSCLGNRGQTTVLFFGVQQSCSLKT